MRAAPQDISLQLSETRESEANEEEIFTLREVLRALRRIRHGHVQIMIQDGKVVQIDQTEKMRLRK